MTRTQADTPPEPKTRANNRGGIPLAALFGVVAGMTAYYYAGRMFAVPVELWNGIETFTEPRWFLAVAVFPALAGLLTGLIVGRGGKWYGMVPVLVIHPLEYQQLSHTAGSDYLVLGYGMFVFFMIVMLELALAGGWVGELIRKRLAEPGVPA